VRIPGQAAQPQGVGPQNKITKYQLIGMENKMKILSYGEDSLTLWIIENNLQELLKKVSDNSNIDKCTAIYRPSFGRIGGADSSQFGEFDAIIISEESLYLCESKWDKSSENIKEGKLQLRKEQIIRHEILKYYIEYFGYGEYQNWAEFQLAMQNSDMLLKHQKTIPSENTLLAKNIQSLVSQVKQIHKKKPNIINLLIYFYNSVNKEVITTEKGFLLITMDYSKALEGQFIVLK
jgi:hypothetical protein